MNPNQLGSFQHIELSAIRPSPTNPRKNFDPVALDELAQSIREIGVTQPILVRQAFDHAGCEMFGRYQIVSGERRWRAAQAAELEEIPAIVRELTDDEAGELQLIENLQRADLHPVEEAEGYRALLASGLHSVEDVARKAGKTAAYVAQRLKLLALELPAKMLFHAGHLTLGHALMLARLTPSDQGLAVRNLLGVNHQPKALDLVAHTQGRIASHGRNNTGHRLVSETEAQLRSWIETHVLLSLAKVPWSLEDPLLVPEAGACTTCPKRTGSNPALFADLTTDQDVCLDASCFATKQKAMVQVTTKAAQKAGKPLIKLSAKPGNNKIEELVPGKTKVMQGQWVAATEGSCKSVRQGLLVDEPGRYDTLKAKPGEVLTVCADQDCKIHRHTVKTVSLSASAGSGRNVAESYEKRQQRERAELATLEKTEKPIRRAIYEQVRLESASDSDSILRDAILEIAEIGEDDGFLERPELQLIGELNGFAVSPGWHSARKDARTALEKMTHGQLSWVLFDALHANVLHIDVSTPLEDDRAPLWKLAKQYDVDADAIAAKLSPVVPPVVPAKPAAVKGKAAKKSGAIDGKSLGAGEKAEQAGA